MTADDMIQDMELESLSIAEQQADEQFQSGGRDIPQPTVFEIVLDRIESARYAINKYSDSDVATYFLGVPVHFDGVHGGW